MEAHMIKSNDSSLHKTAKSRVISEVVDNEKMCTYTIDLNCKNILTATTLPLGGGTHILKHIKMFCQHGSVFATNI